MRPNTRAYSRLVIQWCSINKKKRLGGNVRLGDNLFAAFVIQILFPQLRARCLLLAIARRLRTNDDIGDGQGNLRKERQRKRLNRDIYTFEEVIEKGHIFKIMSTQHISDWNIRLFPSGP